MIISKDASLALSPQTYPIVFPEEIRLLKKGGVFEVWESDYTVRSIRPHVPKKSDEAKWARRKGGYAIDKTTPFSPPQNEYLLEFNKWMTHALNDRQLLPNPCTLADFFILLTVPAPPSESDE